MRKQGRSSKQTTGKRGSYGRAYRARMRSMRARKAASSVPIHQVCDRCGFTTFFSARFQQRYVKCCHRSRLRRLCRQAGGETTEHDLREHH